MEIIRASIAAVVDKVVGVNNSDELGVDSTFLEGIEGVVRLVIVDQRLEAIIFAIIDKSPRCLLQSISISDSDCIGTKLCFHGFIEFWHD